MSSGAPGQIGGGLTGGMFSAAAQNPGIAPLDLSQASIFGAMPGAGNFQSQMGTPSGAANAGSFMQQLPQLLQQSGRMIGGGQGGMEGGGGTPPGMQSIGMGMQGLSMLLPFLLA